ncbi:MAG: T9SS type A sorting domain-containing protein [Saprospiraceae bacterium]|nr:T9SS type A sorting domain-containing protein [Saprospiraceae bacterium]
MLKNLLPSLFLLVSTAVLSQDLHQNLLVYYPLNGNAIDYSGNQLDGSGTARPASDQNDEPDMAMEFNGIDEFIDFPADTSLKPYFPFSIAFWVYMEQGSSIILCTDFAEDNHSGAWFNRTASGQFSYSYGNAEGNTSPNQRYSFSADLIMENEVWYHVAVVWKDARTSDCYINGSIVTKTTSGFASDIAYTSAPGSLGRKDPNVIDPPIYFRGKLNEFYMWDRELTQDDVDELYLEGGLSNTDETIVDDNEIYLHPNPASNIIQLSGKDINRVEKVVIQNIAGTTVMEKELNGQNYLNISDLPKGMYFANFIGKSNASNLSVIKFQKL